jgi:UDP-glucose 6-dehydrogenase
MEFLANTVNLPVGWLLTIVATMAGTIATLAGVIWSSMNATLATMKARIDAQDKIIDHFKADVNRLSYGCGVDVCVWKHRQHVIPTGD